jgi:hypothetical protein
VKRKMMKRMLMLNIEFIVFAYVKERQRKDGEEDEHEQSGPLQVSQFRHLQRNLSTSHNFGSQHSLKYVSHLYWKYLPGRKRRK